MYLVELTDTSGNHSTGTYRARSINQAIDIFKDWSEEVDRYADKRNALAYVYDEQCDYPEFGLHVGPRGGIVRTKL
jgi:hypothetical protein